MHQGCGDEEGEFGEFLCSAGNLGKVLSKYKKVLVPEMNLGQLLFLLRSKFLVDAKGVNKVQGKPFRVSELIEVIEKECK